MGKIFMSSNKGTTVKSAAANMNRYEFFTNGSPMIEEVVERCMDNKAKEINTLKQELDQTKEVYDMEALTVDTLEKILNA